MDTNQLREIFSTHKVSAVALFCALVFGGIFYFRGDALTEAGDALRRSQTLLADLRHNEIESRTLDADLADAKAIYSKLESRSLNFDNNLASQAFFADLLIAPKLKFDSIPTLNGSPVAINSTQFLKGGFILHAEGAAADIWAFAQKCECDSPKALHIERLQVSLAKSESKDAGASGGVLVDFGLRAWGRRGELTAPVGKAKEGRIPSSASVRSEKIKAAKIALHPQPLPVPAFHLVGGSGGGDAGASTPSGVEGALRSLKISVTTFLGHPAVRIEKVATSLLREGGSFDLVSDGASHKITVLSIAPSEVTFQVIGSGRFIKVSLPQ